MRIAIAGFMHESNTFNPLKTDRSAFLFQSLKYGRSLLEEWQNAHHEVGGFIEGVRAQGAELVPVLMAWATPSGPVTDAMFEEMATALLRGLKEHRVDGLLLALHGAMVSESHLDADGAILARLREQVGPEFPIVVTLDLHGNLSERLIELSTASVAYRTCPHIDQRARGLQAADLLMRTLRGEIKPVQGLAKPPVIVNIMCHDTSLAPLQGILEEARRLEEQPGILAVNVLPGFAYADVPHMGPAVVVVADGDRELARREAHRLGNMLWDLRKQLARDLPGHVDAVTRALKSSQTPVVLVDTGDNIGGGSAGDGTVLLAELLRQGGTDAIVCLFAPEEVQQCYRNVGQQVHLRVGGKFDRLHGQPVEVQGKVRLLHDGNYRESQPRHGGKRLNQMGLTALVELPGRIQLVLTSQRHAPFSLGQLTCLGLQPEKQKVLVVKAAIAYKAAYLPIAGSIIEVDTPGLTAVNPARFNYHHIRPMYPLAEID